MATSYTPVSYDYKEIIEEQIRMESSGKIFFFNQQLQLDCVEGKIVSLQEHDGKGWFIELEPHALVRIDRIITFFGKPGPAYDEYDAYGNACLSCHPSQNS